jgi:class 3 adenylate cyclase/tetratricopeptide (TPR) repeat protein
MEGPRRERKVVTVLFADLVGFTARAEQLDPEDVEAILRPYQERLRRELERFGGTVEKFIGDAVMALFGAPVAHEDDPERAVRAALAIRDWAREEEGPQVRIAVTTGEALINFGARPDAGETMATGDVVNTTARLQAAAPVNGVLVGEVTERATRGVIEYRDADTIEAKGKAEPIPVWEAVQARSRVTTEAVSTRTPLVGRERELAVLHELLVRVREESAPQLVTLVGVPGIGKSRLVYELLQIVEESGVLTYWRRGRSLPYGDGVPLWALSEMVKAQAGILESDAPEEAADKLQLAVENAIRDPREASRVEPHLRAIAGIAASEETAVDRRSEGFAAWRRFFESLAEQRPLVLVFEDLQWADEELLEFVDYLVEWASAVPVLIVCTARPELLERRPGWGGGKLNATTLSLAPLSETDTSRLLASLLERPLLPAETQQQLLLRAGGNPLYAEQYAQLLLEGSDSGQLPVPESVHGIIAARLDRLPAGEKLLLQDAAVLGKVFWLGGLVDGRSRSETEQHLHALERKAFVQRARSSSVAEQAEHAFLHLLVRDVAYGQIPRAERAEKHRRAAAWIESLGRPQDHAEMLAYHYSTALDLARASGLPTEQLADRGRLVLREAGDRSMALNAFDSAARSYRSALELWPDDDRERPRLLLALGRALALGQEAGEDELVAAVDGLVAVGDRERAAEAEILLADDHWRSGRRDECYAHVEGAVNLVADIPSSPAKARVLSEVSRYHMLADRFEEAIRLGGEALEMASKWGLDEIRAHALNNIGSARIHSGDAGGIDDLERSIELSNEIGSPESLRGYNNLFSNYVAIGVLAKAAVAVRAGLPVAERFGNAGSNARWLRFERVHVACWEGRWEEAVALIDESLSEVGHGHALSRYGLEVRGRIRLARDDTSGALEDAKASLALARRAKDPQTLFPALSFAAVASLEASRVSDAERLAEELLALKPADHMIPHHISPLLDLAWVLAALDRSQELLEATRRAAIRTPHVAAAEAFARGEYLEAAEIFVEMGSLPNEAFARLRAAGQLVSEDHRAEADEQLQKALLFYRSVGATRHINEGETLLAATHRGVAKNYRNHYRATDF